MKQAWSVLVAAILSCWLAAPAAADPIAAGTGQQTADANGTRITVFTYRPSGCSDPSLLMVFHGLARNPRSYRDDTRALADRHCMLLVAPLFAKQAFPVWRYQQGGIVKDGVIQHPRDWTGRLALDLVDWARKQERRPLSYSLLGHSAGAQFLDRLAAFVPTEARRIVAANAGTYVLPSLEIPAPYGLGKVYAGAEGEAQLRRYLAQPLTIYLGEDDTKEADRNDDDDALAQGVSRLERGTKTFNSAMTLAQARGWPFNWRLVELPGVGHSPRKMFAAPQASEALAP
jgi:pimeloyl-ACP methyl ester carboxylesterase